MKESDEQGNFTHLLNRKQVQRFAQYLMTQSQRNGAATQLEHERVK